MIRAPHHPLPDKRAACWCQRRDTGAERVRDIARAVWSGSQLSHGAKVLLPLWRKPVKSHPEKALIERGHRGDGGLPDRIRQDWRPSGDEPRMAAPLLEEVRVALRHLKDEIHGVRRYLDVLAP